MNYALAALLAFGLLGAAPPPSLVAGSVRDQHGTPIQGARVTIRNGETVVGTAVTAGDGTFVFDGSGSEAIISCRYCRPIRVRIAPDGIATAVVTRYEALLADQPSSSDLAALPYAAASQVLELAPFVVVNETTRTIPGLSATDRNATPYGGLLVLDRVPDYDVTSNTTPFDTIPQGGASQLHVLRVDEAYLYGDTAQAGTFVTTTTGGSSYAASGSDTLVRAAANDSALHAGASFSNAHIGIRSQRGALSVDTATPGTMENLTIASGAGYQTPNAASGLFSSFSSVAAEIRTRRGIDAYARLLADRGTYQYTSARFPDSSVWSDAQFEAGVTSHALVAPFATFSVRQSAGSYQSLATGPASVAGNLSQARAVFGVSHHSDALDVLVAGGTSQVAYAGIVTPALRLSATANDAVASLTYRPSAQWSVHASTSSGYTLQTFLGLSVPQPLEYRPSDPVLLGHTNEALVEFTDASRVRLSATALSWVGAKGASTSSAGASVGWQIAPHLSLRTWLLHESSTLWSAGDVGTAWMTYANDGFRADLVFARSLLDRVPKNHLEGAISGRVNPRLDWFATSAYVAGSQSTALGLRIH